MSGEEGAYDSFISAKLELKFYEDGVEVVPDGDNTVELTFLFDGIEIGSQTLSGTDFELKASHGIYHAEIFLDIPATLWLMTELQRRQRSKQSMLYC